MTASHCSRGLVLFAAVVLGQVPAADSVARGFRGLSPIATPSTAKATQAGVDQRGLEANAPIQAVSREVGSQAVGELVSAWNQGQLKTVLGADFYDKSRLLDAMDADVPRDARLRLVSVRAVQTLSQRIENDPQYGPVLVSQISARARTQVEFTDSSSGQLVNRPGDNEFILEVRQKLPSTAQP